MCGVKIAHFFFFFKIISNSYKCRQPDEEG